jgi:GrpB-like predicted nucleotidyltransferase (UPF0157 family)
MTPDGRRRFPGRLMEVQLTSDVSAGRSITVVDYDPAWSTQFETLQSLILSAVGDIAVAVEHVGSTSVPGLAAKPIIDIDVVVASAADVSVAIERLAVIGYKHRGNLGVEGREACKSPPGPPTRNLYVCVQGGTALRNHLTVRDYLRNNADSAAEYGRLKKQLAARFPTDIDKYIDGKTDFILKVLREMGFTDQQMTAISAINRLQA